MSELKETQFVSRSELYMVVGVTFMFISLLAGRLERLESSFSGILLLVISLILALSYSIIGLLSAVNARRNRELRT